MKYAYILFLVIPFYISSQSWKYETITNDFDGTFKIAIQTANKSSSVYEPALVLNSKGNALITNFYVTDFGVVFDDLTVMLKFDNDENIYYAKTSLSENNKTIFILNARDEFYNVISKIELFYKLTTASKLSLRIQDKYGKDDYGFSLRGSNKAIKHVVGNIDYEIEKLKIAKKLKNDVDFKVQTFMTEIKNLKLGFSSWNTLEDILETDFRQAILDGIEDNYESIILKEHPLEKYKREYQVKVFYKMKDGSEKALTDRYFRVDKDSPIYKRFIEEEKKLKEKENKIIEENEKRIAKIFKMIENIKFSPLTEVRVKRNIEAKIKYNTTNWTYDSIYVVPCNCVRFEKSGEVELYFSKVNNISGFRDDINIKGVWYVSEDSSSRKKILDEIEYFNSLVPKNITTDLSKDRRDFVSKGGDINSIQSIYINEKRGNLSKKIFKNNGRELYVIFKDGRRSLLSKYVKIK